MKSSKEEVHGSTELAAMFYDLNVPWTATDTGLPRTLNFLYELGYNVVALNYSMTGKLPNELVSSISHTSCDSD